jgi:hypothetical protein
MKMSIALFCLAIGANSFAQSTAPTPNENDGPITLLCKAATSDHQLARNLVVDYQRSTVNGTRAKITDTLITWQTVEPNPSRTGKTTFDHEVNRLTGTYHVNGHTPGAIYGGPPPTYPTFHCEKAAATKKF